MGPLEPEVKDRAKCNLAVPKSCGGKAQENVPNVFAEPTNKEGELCASS